MIFDKRFTRSNGIYYVDNNITPTNLEQVKANIDAVIKSLNAKSLVILKQVHGNKVYYAKPARNIQYDSNLLPIADAAVTNVPGVALAIQTADCVPVLLFNDHGNTIGAVHCGWRSAKANIIRNTVELMREIDLQSNIKAIIGPAIQQNSYEVGIEFYNDFINEDQSYRSFFKNTVTYSGKFLFNLVEFVRKKLLDENIKIVETYNDDTFSLPQIYYSYRYNIKSMDTSNYYGRMLSAIVINHD